MLLLDEQGNQYHVSKRELQNLPQEEKKDLIEQLNTDVRVYVDLKAKLENTMKFLKGE